MSRLGIRGPDGERGSMPLLLLVSLVGMLIGALMVPMVINQDRTTRYATSRVQALGAAQAGIDVALGRIRAATVTDLQGNVSGSSAQLPCADQGSPLTGPVNSEGNGEYAVSITYYTDDPVAYPTARKMSCFPGFGTYDSGSGTTTPKYAKLESTGTDGPAVNGVTRGRTIVSYYKLRTTDLNIPGGVIRLYPANGNSPQLCIDAGSGTPAVGTALYLATCSATNPPAAQQVFAYRPDLTLQLVSSATPTNPNGLCIDSAAPLKKGNPVTLQNCAPLNSPPYDQQWSFNDVGHFEGSKDNTATTGNLANICINASTQAVGEPVIVDHCAGSISDPAQAWIPAASVGAGASGSYRLKATFTEYQLVNFGEFGRCLDVTHQDPHADHLIDYPCKQNPYGGAVAWNQKFTAAPRPDGYTRIETTTDKTRYCLTSAGISGAYSTVKVCDDTNVNQAFTLDVTKYTIQDYGQRCLGLTDPTNSEPWSVITTSSCTGARTQKWDADPNISVPILQNTSEHPVVSPTG